jgi:heme-degrading monooxygenase HmoA
MVARVTLAEIDAVRMSVLRAVKLFEDDLLPDLREQEGYEGCYVLTTPEGKALVMTFWTDDVTAEAGIESGAYGARVEKFVTVMRASPGRETYDVAVADARATILG